MIQQIHTPGQLGAELRAQRKLMGLTQKQAAENVGLQAKTVSALEHNPERTTVESLFKLLSALGMHIKLEAGKDKMKDLYRSEW